MKNVFATLLLATVSLSTLACANPATAAAKAVQAKSSLYIDLVQPLAGMDFPTDRPEPKALEGKLILTIGEHSEYGSRIVVPGDTQLVNPEAGLDFPTEIPTPASLRGKKILVLGETFRLPVSVEKAQAGLDFPTDSPNDFGLNLMWDMGLHQRVSLNGLRAIEKAVAGIDFPTDGPASLPRDFWVLKSYDSEFHEVRTVIKASL